MLRKVAAVIAGIIAAVGIFMAFEYLNGKLYLVPPGLDPADHEAMSEYVDSLPSTALWVVLAGWMAGSFICGVLVRVISKSNDMTPAYLAGLFLMAAGIVDIFLLPHPLWFIVTGVLIFIPVTLAGHTLVKRNHK
jgi:hypothetical protein